MRRVPLLPLVAAAGLVVSLFVASPVAAQQTAGLSDARRRADAATAAVQDLERELGELDGELVRLEAAQAEAEAALEGLRVRVRDLALERYMSIGQDEFAFLSVDINEQERARAMAAVVSQTDNDAIDEYRAIRAEVERNRRELDGRLAEQADKLENLREQRARLDRELAALEEQEAERIAAERAAAEAARQAAAAQVAATAPTTGASSAGPATTAAPGAPATTAAPGPTTPPVTGGSWICPVQGARSFVDTWGAARPGGRAHQGVDIMSPRGTPVVTPVSGTVMLKTGGIGGLTFRLDGDDGNWYYGAHLDSYAGAEGRLPAGTTVGFIGDTGDAKGAGTHLHFEIHIGGYGNPVNPYPTVARYC